MLHPPMVLFDVVVQILATSHFHSLRQLATLFQIGYGTMGGSISIKGDLCRRPLSTHRFAQECLGGCYIAVLAQVEIHLRIPMMSISHSDLMSISSERSD